MLVKTSSEHLPQVQLVQRVSVGSSRMDLPNGKACVLDTSYNDFDSCSVSSETKSKGKTDSGTQTQPSSKRVILSTGSRTSLNSNHVKLRLDVVPNNQEKNCSKSLNLKDSCAKRRRKSLYNIRRTLRSSSPTNSSDSFKTYCRETSLHGWKYIAFTPGTRLERFGWLCLLVSSLLTAFVLVYKAVGDFVAQTVSTNMDSLSTSFDNLYFPAITICNINFMQRSVLEKYSLQNNETVIDIFDRMMNTGSADNFTVEELQVLKQIENMTGGTQELKMEGHPECHNMFMHYSWKNQEIKYEEGDVTMHYRQTTDASLCCQLFPGMLPNENNRDFDITSHTFWRKKNPWQIIFDGYKTGIRPGKQGVQIMIDVEAYDYFSVHSKDSEGVLVLIQHYRDIPLMRKESFMLSPGFEVDVGLSITEIITTEAAISRFKPEERDCYTHDEVNLTSLPLEKGYRMSMKNCLYDKALHATLEECNCRPPFYVLGAIGKNVSTCHGTQLLCAYKIFDNVDEYRTSDGTAKTCRAPCNDQIYHSRITFAKYPNKAMFGKSSKGLEFCKVVKKLLKICHEWVDPDSFGAYGLYGDELKIRRRVLAREYPELCDNLVLILGGNSTDPIAISDCELMSKAFVFSPHGQKALDALYLYAKKNLLWLNVYVKDSFATRIVRDERMTITSFVANVGGLLGLCMGFSLVSVAEMVYFCVKQKLFGCWSALKKKTKRPTAEESSTAETNNF